MRKLWSTATFPSEKNGAIRVEQRFFRATVKVGIFDQTSPYVTTMWKKAVRRISNDHSVHRILLLGLGAGGIIRFLLRRFPRAELLIVEWDPVMIRLARDLGFLSNSDRVVILQEDAASAVEKINSPIDLLLMDLYRGCEPAPALRQPAFIQVLANLLTPDGILLLNGFRSSEELFPAFDRVLSRHSTWQYKYNRLALYHKFGQGKIGDPLPTDFIHPRQSPLYLSGTMDQAAHAEVVGKPGAYGLRWHRGPLWFERYDTDEEPSETFSHRRWVHWQSLTRTKRPKGWMTLPTYEARQIGFSKIEADDYWKPWTSHAQRHRRQFLRQTALRIEPVPIDEFCAAYMKISKLLLLKIAYRRLLVHRFRINKDLLHCMGARTSNGRVIAGLAVLDLPDIHLSNHLISFLDPSYKSTSVGVGLIDEWFRRSQTLGHRFLNFGTFWAPGDPRAWKGFSAFKSQFGIHFLRYPRPWVRISS